MKTNTDPAFPPRAQADSVAPDSGDSPASRKEQELDELRRFRVRTVPPDVRRQWLLAETPAVSRLELSDTVPPDHPDAGQNPMDRTPSDIRSLRAETRKLRTVEPRRDPPQRLVFVTTATVVGVVVFTIAYLISGGRPAALYRSPAAETRAAPIEDISATHEKQKENTAILAPPAPSTPRAEPPAAPTANPTPTPAKRERVRVKDPESGSSSSRTMPAAASPPSGTDIRTPLFGK